MDLTRREALLRLGVTASSSLLFAKPLGSISLRQDKSLDLPGLARDFRDISTAKATVFGAKTLQGGVSVHDFIDAVFLAGVDDIAPQPLGGKLHAVMMIASSSQLMSGASQDEARHIALWSLHDFKRYQQRDQRDGDWVMPPRPVVKYPSESKAREDLIAGMDAWDPMQVDRAVLGLLPEHDRESLFELLWPYAARSYVDLGHKIIYCAQVERTLMRLPWKHAEPALRSLVMALAYPGTDDRMTGPYEHCLEIASDLPAEWLEGSEDPKQSLILLEALREANSAQAQDLVAAALKDGVGPATVWDGLRLYASELFYRRSASATRRHTPVHPVTEVNAFGYAFRTTRSDRSKRLMILSAAGWLPLLRADIEEGFGALSGPGIDALNTSPGQGAKANLSEALARRSPELTAACLGQAPELSASYYASLRSELISKATQDHQFKLLAAIAEESTLVNPRWLAHSLAPAVSYLPGAGDRQSDAFEKAKRALQD